MIILEYTRSLRSYQEAVLVCLGCYNKMPQARWLMKNKYALVGVTQWTECRPENQRVPSFITS